MARVLKAEVGKKVEIVTEEADAEYNHCFKAGTVGIIRDKRANRDWLITVSGLPQVLRRDEFVVQAEENQQ